MASVDDQLTGTGGGGARQGFAPVAREGLKTNDNNGARVYKYPLFIQSDDSSSFRQDEEIAQECIRFTAVKQGGVSIDSQESDRVRRDTGNSITTRQNGRLNAARNLANSTIGTDRERAARQNAFEQISNQTNEVTNRVSSGNFDDATLSTGGDIIRNFLARQSENINKPEVDLEQCFLYMPPSIVYNEGAVWGKASLGAAGNALASAVKGGDVTDILKDFGIGIAPEAGMAIALGATHKIGGLLSAAGLGAIGQGVPGAIGQTARVAQNPYEEQLFQGIDFRVFSFQFDFNPVSQPEYQEVKKIITMFRKNSKPTFTLGGDSQALYSYPNEFRIEFLHLNPSGEFYSINDALPKIHNCVLTNITTNYTPDQWRSHIDGTPNSIMIQLAFTETVKITQSDIDGGY